MTIDEIIKKREELNSQIQELVNNFHKETGISIEGIGVMYNCFYRKYFTEVNLENPFE